MWNCAKTRAYRPNVLHPPVVHCVEYHLNPSETHTNTHTHRSTIKTKFLSEVFIPETAKKDT